MKGTHMSLTDTMQVSYHLGQIWMGAQMLMAAAFPVVLLAVRRRAK
jgi:hypothetical protein